MDAKTLFKQALDIASECARRVEATQLKNPTPCTEWDVRALLNHMAYELAWAADLLSGKTIAEVGKVYDGDLLGEDPISSWQQRADAALAAVAKADMADTVHLSYADVSADHYIRECGIDMLVHGWDVGQAMQCSMVFGDQLAQAALDFVTPRAAEFHDSGLFGKSLPTRESDNPEIKLLAFYGRREGWQESGSVIR